VDLIKELRGESHIGGGRVENESREDEVPSHLFHGVVRKRNE